jgi:hypothetical protein
VVVEEDCIGVGTARVNAEENSHVDYCLSCKLFDRANQIAQRHIVSHFVTAHFHHTGSAARASSRPPSRSGTLIKDEEAQDMQTRKATAVAFPNIALIKYWGNRDQALRLPSNESLSFNLGDLRTTTTVEFDHWLDNDEVLIDGNPASGQAFDRVVHHLDRIADSAPIAGAQDGRPRARVTSSNTFPMGVGIASSASGFAALTLAACTALGLQKTEAELSSLARLGSGSACRSIPGGFVLWQDAFAISIAPPGTGTL